MANGQIRLPAVPAMLDDYQAMSEQALAATGVEFNPDQKARVPEKAYQQDLFYSGCTTDSTPPLKRSLNGMSTKTMHGTGGMAETAANDKKFWWLQALAIPHHDLANIPFRQAH